MSISLAFIIGAAAGAIFALAFLAENFVRTFGADVRADSHE
jgi:hypothetical protein